MYNDALYTPVNRNKTNIITNSDLGDAEDSVESSLSDAESYSTLVCLKQKKHIYPKVITSPLAKEKTTEATPVLKDDKVPSFIKLKNGESSKLLLSLPLPPTGTPVVRRKIKKSSSRNEGQIL